MVRSRSRCYPVFFPIFYIYYSTLLAKSQIFLPYSYCAQVHLRGPDTQSDWRINRTLLCVRGLPSPQRVDVSVFLSHSFYIYYTILLRKSQISWLSLPYGNRTQRAVYGTGAVCTPHIVSCFIVALSTRARRFLDTTSPMLGDYGPPIPRYARPSRTASTSLYFRRLLGRWSRSPKPFEFREGVEHMRHVSLSSLA